MEFIEIIKENEKQLFDSLKEDIKNDPLIKAKVENIDRVLEIQEALLIEYLRNFNKNEFKEEKLTTFYKEFDVPYEVIYRALNVLKDKVLLLLKKEHLSLVEIYNFNSYFQTLLDLIAKVYIKRSVAKLREVTTNIFRDKILISVHISWLNQIAMAIEKDELQYYPLVTLKECKFNKYLYYPESLMICLDKKLCVYLEEMHKIMHRLADTLYLHLKNNEFAEGFFVFKDFVNQAKKFIDTISDMYYMTYSNPERSLLKFLELVGFDKEIFVSMISFSNYMELVEEFGEKIIIEALNIIVARLESIIDKSNTILIKGFNFNLFLANLDVSVNSYKKFIESLNGYFEVEIDSKRIVLDPIIVGFEVDMYKNIKSYEIIEILDVLKEKAIKENQKILLMVDEHKKFVNELIADKYDGKFILSAFDKGDIEIVAQPIFDRNNGIYALEVLGRVRDYKKLVPMRELIEKIEEMGLLKTLDLLVGVKLNDYSKYLSKLTRVVFINVNFESMLNRSYLKNLKEFQEKLGIEIILEVNEIDFLSQYKILENIYKEYNLHFAIDNFESQCISVRKFIYLVERGIVKYLKISKLAFGKHQHGVLKILKFLHDSFNVKIVIKHIENEEMLKAVEKYGFDYIQGFLLEKPKPIDEILLDNS